MIDKNSITKKILHDVVLKAVAGCRFLCQTTTFLCLHPTFLFVSVASAEKNNRDTILNLCSQGEKKHRNKGKSKYKPLSYINNG